MPEQKTSSARRATPARAGTSSARRATTRTEKPRRAVRDTSRQKRATADDATATARDAASGARTAPEETIEEVKDRDPVDAGGALESARPDRSGRDQPSLREELGDIVRETAIEILGPVARNATKQAARFAVKRGPQIISQTVVPRVKNSFGPAIEEAGGPGELARDTFARLSDRSGEALSKVGIGRDGDEESSTDSWSIPTEESIDIAVPVETAYEQFNRFEERAKFMSRGERVDDRPNERIEWESPDRAGAGGVITFHGLSDRLTRVMVTFDSHPHGLVEKTSSALRLSRRALRSDLMRFKAFAEMNDANEPGRGEEPDEEEERAPRRPRAKRPAAQRQPAKTRQRPKTRQRR